MLRSIGSEIMLALEVIAGALLALFLAAMVVRHDAAQVGWRRVVGFRKLGAVLTIDCSLTLGVYFVLTFGAGLVWHLLAAQGWVHSRSRTQPWSLLLYAITAGLAASTLLGRRIPFAAKTLGRIRAGCLLTIQVKAAQQESTLHEMKAEPALARYAIDALERTVTHWARIANVDPQRITLMSQVIQADDVDNRLALCSLIYQESGGARFLDKLIKEAPPAHPGP